MGSHLDYEINKELGECYLFMGELDRAEDYYNKAIGSNGVHPEPYLGLATIAVQRGDLDKALELYRKADSIAASDKALAGMALVEMETGAHDEAFAHVTKALEINPSNLIALFSLIRIGHVLNRLAETMPHLVNYLTIDPAQHDVRYSLAGCLASLGRNEEAKKELDTILLASPDHAAAKELASQL